MDRTPHRRWVSRISRALLGVACLVTAMVSTAEMRGQSATSASAPSAPSPRQRREADDAYLAGARQLAHNDAAAAEHSFARAVALDPGKSDYALSLAVAKEHHVTALVQQAVKARLLGNAAEAERLFAEGKALDPDNEIVKQHLAAAGWPEADLLPRPVGFDDITKLGGPIKLKPASTLQTFHRRGDAQELIREVYTAYGIKTTFDPSITSQALRLDLENVDFDTASRILLMMTHVFAVPLEENSALLAKDTQENRDRLEPQFEETVFLPALPPEQLTELSNVAKTVFDIKQVTVQPTGGSLVLRGNEGALRLVNAAFADIVDGGADVMLELHLYEVDKNHMRNIGATLPGSASVFSITAAAQQLVSANQSLIDQAVAAGVLKLSGTPLNMVLQELAFLIASGAVSGSQYTNLLGTFGHGLTFAGLALSSGSTFNLLVSSSDVRTLDDVQMRVGDRQQATFRAGTRYPITTSTYSSGVSSSLASALKGVNVNGTPASQLLSQFLTNSSATVPQVSFEDLGLTLKATPQVLKSGQVFVHLEMKIEALGGAQINNIPVLNSRQLTTDMTIPEGQTALLISSVSNLEQHTIEGLPGISEIPGFQGTDKVTEKDSGELLITLTPHLVRRRSSMTASRRLLANISPAQQ